MNARIVEVITSSFILIAAFTSVLLLILINKDLSQPVQIFSLLNWINGEVFTANWAIRVDILSVLMFTVVNIVSFVVHSYSIGYMAEDPERARFMPYLSLFTFFMLLLVSSNNLLQLFVGWEGVGLCSYLLIGFWHGKESANRAAIKAFIVNRIGDFAFIIGIILIFLAFKTIQFDQIFKDVSLHNNDQITIFNQDFHLITVIAIFLFIGAMGKSAQLGLHVWLPDAMEGPTPVSALIHAATMVTAGVFLVIRMSPLFEYAELAREIIILVGALTAFFCSNCCTDTK